MDKFNLKSQYSYICELQNLLLEDLEQQDLLLSDYYELPVIKTEDEENVPTEIAVKKWSGSAGFERIKSSYFDHFTKTGISSKVLQRHPGLLQVNADNPERIKDRIKSINKAKEEFKNIVLSIDHNNARFEFVHQALPGLITLAVYRKIHFETELPYSVRFTWMHKNSIKTFTKEQALEILERSAAYGSQRVIDSESWASLVEKEKLALANLNSNQKLRVRRPTRVSPQVNVRFSQKNRYHVSAALPFIMLNNDKNIKFGNLVSYQRKETDPRTIEQDFLVKRLYLTWAAGEN